MGESNAANSAIKFITENPGYATLIVCAILLFLTLILLAMSKPLREFFRGWTYKWRKGDTHFDVSPAVLPAPSENGRDVTASTSVPPPADSDVENDGGPARVDHPSQPTEELPSAEIENELTLERQLFIAGYGHRSVKEIETAYEKLTSLADRRMSEEQLESLRWRLRLHAGDKSAEGALKELETDHPEWTEPSTALAEYYIRLSRSDLAEAHLDTALRRANDEFTIAYVAGIKAEVILQVSGSAIALSYLSDTLHRLTIDSAKANVLDRISEAHKIANNKMAAAKALEQALNLTPGDDDRRFKAAYLYSEMGEHLLALFHYKILTENSPQYTNAMNNLGVVYDRLSLPGKRVDAWRTAGNAGETHALGNLAIEMVRQGFHAEARELLRAVPANQSSDPRIVDALKFIASTKKQEDETLTDLHTTMVMHHNLILLSTEKEKDAELADISMRDITGEWKMSGTKSARVEFSLGDGLLPTLKASITETGTTRRSGGALFGLGAFVPSEKRSEGYVSKNGLLLKFSATPKDSQPAPSLLSIEEPTRNFALVIFTRDELRGIYWSDQSAAYDVLLERVT